MHGLIERRTRRKPVAIKYGAGFTYIGLLILVAVMGAMLAVVGTIWHTAMQREKGRELLFVGDQFRQAIGAYYENSPGAAKQFPRSLEDLLQDRRYPVITRYLRKIYYDPFTNSTDWGLVKDAAGNITGVYSLSEEAPVKTANFGRGDEQFSGKQHYSEWKFIYIPGGTTANNGIATGNAVPPAGASQSSGGSGQSGQTIASGGQPTPALPPAYTPLKPVPPPPDASQSERQKYYCGLMHYSDVGICATMLLKFGQAQGDSCLASATARYGECLNGDPIETLAVWYQ